MTTIEQRSREARVAAIVNQPNYTIKAAAARVGRSERTIERWIKGGMTCRVVAGRIVIDRSVLLAELVKQVAANPSRARRTDQGSSTMSV